MATFFVNGNPVEVDKNQKLLRYLRDELRLTSAKDGCSEGACGTCTVLIDGKAACALVPSDKQVNMKQLAALAGGKKAAMMPAPEAERFTAYKVGGISPLGQKRAAPVFLDESAFNFESIFINGGGRGLQILIAPDKLVEAAQAKVAAFTA